MIDQDMFSIAEKDLNFALEFLEMAQRRLEYMEKESTENFEYDSMMNNRFTPEKIGQVVGQASNLLDRCKSFRSDYNRMYNEYVQENGYIDRAEFNQFASKNNNEY